MLSGLRGRCHHFLGSTSQSSFLLSSKSIGFSPSFLSSVFEARLGLGGPTRLPSGSATSFCHEVWYCPGLVVGHKQSTPPLICVCLWSLVLVVLRPALKQHHYVNRAVGLRAVRFLQQPRSTPLSLLSSCLSVHGFVRRHLSGDQVRCRSV